MPTFRQVLVAASLVAASLVAVSLVAVSLVAAPVAAHAETLAVGTVTLERCEAAAPDGWCGAIERPLDPARRSAGTIAIGFEWYQHTAPGRSAGTVVAIQGGPGFATSAGRAIFRGVLAEATGRRDLLLLDLRGTGSSGAIDCPAAQAARIYDVGAARDCAAILGPAAGLYGTVAGADDLAALLDALGVGRVDLFAASFGTVFGQVFALRHGDRLRTLVLDSPLPMDADLFERSLEGWRAFARGLDTICKRGGRCTSNGWRDDLRGLLADGRATDTTGLGAGAVFDMVSQAGYDGLSYRELDAAAAAFRRGDAAPLLRLLETARRDQTMAIAPPAIASAGAFLSVSCTDIPMPFGAAADPAARRAAAEAALTAFLTDHEAVLAPFTVEEIARDKDEARFCTEWPEAPHAVLRVTDLPAEGPFPDVPTLILSGELDTVTPPAMGAIVAGRFPRATRILIRNGLHGAVVTAPWMWMGAGEPTTDCIASVVGRFVADLAPGDTGCLQSRPSRRIAAGFPRRLADVAPAEPGGAEMAEADLRLAAAVAGTAGDVVGRVGRSNPWGLRGGTIEVASVSGGFRVTLHAVRWVEDLALTGSIRLASDSGVVTASFAVEAPGGVTGTLSVGWAERDADPTAIVTGTLEGGPLGDRPVFARLPAP